jgi:predicted  nucleic acid-binding Zn-ribbon protein
MEEAEPLADAVATAGADVDRMRAEGQQLQQRMAASQSEIEAEIASLTAQQAAQRALVPEGALADYDRRRTRGGVVVGRLEGAACTACSLTLPSVDVERIRRAPDDQPGTCPECGALLVR